MPPPRSLARSVVEAGTVSKSLNNTVAGNSAASLTQRASGGPVELLFDDGLCAAEKGGSSALSLANERTNYIMPRVASESGEIRVERHCDFGALKVCAAAPGSFFFFL